ncbi:JAB domain-containing protein [Flavobacterium supellecticarium]|uniref:JAB domain-containing protein n=1 Tax=Flavobacterium supellecticarium TaxID=2565924 RepID=A0A4S3ZX78_9FLAO|nr:DNA repair protein RadC [Flavobacterium supellecticarium]THF50482.1 JAB domain-containing protein [Flavobacterium supellecticarium]
MEIINYIPIKDWAPSDQPREKLIEKGRTNLSNTELLTILIRSGSEKESALDLSKKIMRCAGNNLNTLGKLSVKQLMSFKGIGQAKAVTIIAALELGRRRKAEASQWNLPIIMSSRSVFTIMQPIIGELSHEEFWILLLDNSNKLIHKYQISKGGLTATLVDPRLIFKTALEHSATGVILTHNHPSGSLKASETDINITYKLKEAGDYLDIMVLDHIIVTESEYFSFRDEKLL